MNTRWLMLSMPLDGSIGALSSAGGWCAGGWINGLRSTPFGATDGSGVNAPSGHVGTCSAGVSVADASCVGPAADTSVPGDPVVQATAITATSTTTGTSRTPR